MLKTLEQVRRSDAPQCGAKSACLGELFFRGYAVPASLVLPTRVFATFLASNGLEALARGCVEEGVDAGPARLVEIEREIFDRFEASELPRCVRDEIDAWTGSHAGPFAVRSSATNEDLAGATFAGQYNSFLTIGAPDVSRMARRCFASLFNARAALYRRRKGLPTIGSMAVIVQTMVPCVHAGIVFTHAPRRPGMLLIECTAGLSEGVASGSVAPNRYYVNRSTLDVEDARELCPIDVASVLAAGRVALSIEMEFGGPHDVEYGVADAGLYILQARPISS